MRGSMVFEQVVEIRYVEETAGPGDGARRVVDERLVANDHHVWIRTFLQRNAGLVYPALQSMLKVAPKPVGDRAHDVPSISHHDKETGAGQKCPYLVEFQDVPRGF